GSRRSNQPCQWCCNPIQISFEFREMLFRDVTQSFRDMEAIPNFGERRFRNVQEMQTYSPIPPRETFHDIRGHRVSRASKLRGQLKSLDIRKLFGCELMQSDEEVVRPLPSDEFVMSEIHWSSSDSN